MDPLRSRYLTNLDIFYGATLHQWSMQIIRKFCATNRGGVSRIVQPSHLNMSSTNRMLQNCACWTYERSGIPFINFLIILQVNKRIVEIFHAACEKKLSSH